MKIIGRTSLCVAAVVVLGACGGEPDTDTQRLERTVTEPDALERLDVVVSGRGDSSSATQKAVQSRQQQVFNTYGVLVGNTASEVCVISGVAAALNGSGRRLSLYQTDTIGGQLAA